MILEYLISSIWFILPAYIANAAPVFIKTITTPHPIDRGKLFYDKKPILGPGKTREGFIFAVLLGVIIGYIQSNFNYLVPNVEIKMTIWLAFLLATGAMFGDLVASFFKRRLGFKRGDSVFLLDQLDFIIMAIIFASILVSPSMQIWIVLLIITPMLNFISNGIAYILKLKDVWW